MSRERVALPAVLLMESHGLAPNVRSTSFASVKVWARLYQAGPYFLDLNLVPGEDGLSVRGELLVANDTPAPEGGTATLSDPSAGPLARAELSADRTFVLPVSDTGRFRLDVTLAGETLRLDELTID